MTTDKKLPARTGLREQLIFVAFLIPTFLVIAAAAVSLTPDERASQVVAVCGGCSWDSGEDGP